MQPVELPRLTERKRHNRAPLEAAKCRDLVFENICRRLYPLRLFFRRRFPSRAVWEPFQIPSCDANAGRVGRFTDYRGNNKRYEQSEQGAFHETRLTVR